VVSDKLKFIKTKADPKFAKSQQATEFCFWADAFLRKNPVDDLDKALSEKPDDEFNPPNFTDEPWPEST